MKKVLGLYWNLAKDVFEFQSKIILKPNSKKEAIITYNNVEELQAKPPPKLTRRQALSQLNSIYDHLGLAAPFIVKAKILMRETWNLNEGSSWDEHLPEQITSEWLSLFEEIFEMSKIDFRRCITPIDSVGDPMLVIFSDASKAAYGAAAYVVWTLSGGSNEARLVLAKSRLAPKKQISIVRLELCGVLLAVRLKKFLFKHSRLNFTEVMYIVDSEIVRAMIQKESYGFNTFTGVRLGEIQQTEDSKSFYWCAGEWNIADLISRGASPNVLGRNSTWQCGPVFLKQDKKEWPLEQKTYKLSDLPEVASSKVLFNRTSSSTVIVEYDVSRFSSLSALVRTVARILSLKNEKSLTSLSHAPDVQQIQDTWAFIIKKEQVSIASDFAKGCFENLGAFLDDRGVIKVGRRINETVPIIPKSQLGDLIIKEFHEKGHGGVRWTASKVRTKVWMLNLLKVIKSFIRRCPGCRIYNKEKAEQLMGAHSDERLNPSFPFTNICLDLFGPFEVRDCFRKCTRRKIDAVIYTCLFSRAVHLDVVTDCSTEDFLQTFRRFVALRGYLKLYIPIQVLN